MNKPKMLKKGLISLFVSLFFATASYCQLRADFIVDKSGGCSPLTVAFTNRTSGASSAAKYEWDLGNGNSSSLQNPGAIYTTAKTYTVTLKVTDGFQTASKTATVTVYKDPEVDFNAVSAKVCLPDAASFTSSSKPGDGAITGYYWDFGDGAAQQGYGSSMSHAYTYEQQPAVSLTITNSYGCTATKVKAGTITVLPVLNASFTTPKTIFCSKDDPVTFTNTSNGGGGSALSYTWNFGDATSSTVTSPAHTYGKKNLYAVSLTVKNADGCTTTTQSNLNVAYFNTDFSTGMLCRQVTFYGSSYLYPTSSAWSFGDATTGNTVNSTSHIYNTEGAYTVRLINTYNSVCPDTVVKTITVQDNVAYNSDFTIPAVICRSSSYIFNGSSAVQPSARLWEFGDNTTDTYNATTYHTYSRAGTYTIKLTNTFGTCKEVVSKTINVNELPAPNGFGAEPSSLCGAPSTVQFKDTTSDAVKWDWQLAYNYSNGGTFRSTLQNPSYVYTSDGVYTVSLTVTNAAGCVNYTSKSIQIARPSVYINTLSTSYPGGINNCGQVIKKFSANSSEPISSYQWNFSDGTQSTDPQPVHTFTTFGNNTVSLFYTTVNGCTGVIPLSFIVYDNPKAAFAYFLPACNSLPTISFSNLTTPYTGASWTFGDNSSGSEINPSHSYRDTGYYNVKLIAYNGGCTDTVTKQVYTNVPGAFVTITRALQQCATQGTVTFDQQSLRAGGGQWNFGDGTTLAYDSSNHAVKHTYTTTGTYTATLTATFGLCTLTSSQTFNVLVKQKPVLTADKAEICGNETVTTVITNLDPNPYQIPYPNSYWYNLQKFEYDNGTSFYGSISYADWSKQIYKSTISNLAKGDIKVRAILQESGTTCYDTTNYISIKVNGPAAAIKINPASLCYKSVFTLEDASAVITNTPISRWQWNFGDGNTQTASDANPVQHTYINPGTYYPTLTVTDASGCTSNSAYASVVVNAKGPKAAFTPSISISGIYLPDVPLNSTITFYNYTSANSNTINYVWDYGDGTSGTAFTGSHTYTQPGQYTVKLTATDPAFQCSDAVTYVINVKPFNTAFRMNVSYVNAAKCPPAVVQFTNTSAGAVRVIWNFGDGTTAEGPGYFSPAHIFEKSGQYKITLSTYGYNGLTGTYYDSITVTKPQANITADALQGCTSQTVNFTAASTDAISHLWDFGDGTIETTAPAATHQYKTPGIFTAAVLVKDANGCGTVDTMKQKIIIDSLNIMIQGIPAHLCEGTAISFNPATYSVAEQAGRQLNYEWDFGTGNPVHNSSQKMPVFTYPSAGTYTVRLKASSPYGCAKQAMAQVTVYEFVKGTITAPPQVCEQLPVSFTGSVPAGKNVTWNWLFANGNTSTAQNPAPQVYTIPGDYKVQLVVNNSGCFDTVLHSLKVAPKPVVTLSPQTATVCLGQSLQLAAGGGSSYEWSPATGLNNVSAANPVATPAASVNYTVKVTSSFGCINKDSVRIFVAQPITLSTMTDVSVCKGAAVQLSATGATTYQWINTTTGLNNTSINNPVATPTQNTVYTVVGYDAYNCFTDKKDITVNVRPLPTVDAGADAEVLAATDYQLQPTGSADIVRWLWSPADYLSCTACQSPVARPRAFMDYTVTVKNSYGCTASDVVKINLTCSGSYVYIPNSFTPNRDGKNDIFYIKGKGIGIIKYLKIYNRWGEVVFEKQNFPIDDKSAGWNGWYKGGPAAPGTYVYLAEMACAGGEPFVKKGTVTIVY